MFDSSLLGPHVLTRPDKPAVIFLHRNQGEQECLTFEQLDARARVIAAHLLDRVPVGSRALLLYPPGIEYVSAFMGCLYAGIVAVPLYPPRGNQHALRIIKVVADCDAAITLTDSRSLHAIEAFMASKETSARIPVLSTDQMVDAALSFGAPLLDGSSLAFLQYTSGSTGNPKGVMVSHDNLISNQIAIGSAFATNEDDVCLTWLPLYHDMGLIGTLLHAIYRGFSSVLMSPIHFIQDPIGWLEKIAAHKATLSGAPNFAYELCLQKADEQRLAALDLSSWRVAFCGAEPVRASTIERFSKHFAAANFHPEAFTPCYGMAESTLLISAANVGQSPMVASFDKSALEENEARFEQNSDDSMALAGCGQIQSDHELAIVDPATKVRLSEGRVGEIWFRGPSVSTGYYGKDTLNSEIFQARISAEDGSAWLRTGDLGFIHHEQLFITGRRDDLVIIRGRNYYPQDIELTVSQSHPAIRNDCCAAFSVDVDGTSHLVVVAELNRGSARTSDPNQIIEKIRECVSTDHQLQLHGVVLIRHGSIPKTSSGKIRRFAAREAFRDEKLKVLFSDVLDAKSGLVPSSLDFDLDLLRDMDTNDPRRSTLLTNYFRQTAASLVGIAVEGLDLKRSLNSYGIDSIGAISLQSRVEEDLGIQLPITEILYGSSIENLLSLCLASRVEPAINDMEPSLWKQEFPLSPNQAALYYLYRLNPTSGAYNVSLALRIDSPFDPLFLQKAFKTLVTRHASLRMQFEERDGSPVQVINGRPEFEFSDIDADSWDDSALDAFLAKEAGRPFDLNVGTLARVSVLRRGPVHILLISFHHIAVDLWSVFNIMNELQLLYNQCPVQDLPELKASAATHIHRQQQLLNGERGAELRSFWEFQLAGDLPVLDLPLTRSRPAVQSSKGAAKHFRFDTDLCRRLSDLARSLQVTPYTILLSLYLSLLKRYTTQDEILVGTPTSGRGHKDMAPLVGYFVNPVVLRAGVANHLSFTVLCAQVKDTVVAALEHADYPFQLLVEKLQATRDPSRSPIFQTMFTLQRPHLHRDAAPFAIGHDGHHLQLGKLSLFSVAVEQHHAQFDLSLQMAWTGEGILGTFEYASDLFSSDFMVRMIEHFHILSKNLTENPDAPLGTVSMLPSAERSRLLSEWSGHGHIPKTGYLHELIEEHARTRPTAPCLLSIDQSFETIDYDRMNRLANRLAHHLISLGIRRDDAVGLWMERSPAVIIAMMAVFKAGAAFVPLATNLPKERVDLIAGSAAMKAWISTGEPPPGDYSVPIIPLKLDGTFAGDQPESNPELPVHEHQAAYIIYTSGTTGLPKGVVLHQGGVAHFVWTVVHDFKLTDEGRFLQFANLSFDLSILEIFPPLSLGAPLALRSQDMLAGMEFLDCCEQLGITHLFLATSFWHQLVAELTLSGRAWPECIIACNFGGEAAHAEAVSRWPDLAPHCSLLNTYGPTEATVIATYCWLHERSQDPSAPVPIGYPLSDSRTYVVNNHMETEPAGIKGQLLLGGSGLARGYKDSPALTAVRFVPDPFSNLPGARLYCSGDLVCFQDDGSILYLGRIDHQVKIRGYRVELGEIEACLARHEHVKRAVVITSMRNDRNELVAYVAFGDKLDKHSSKRLKSWLRTHLPDYMVPSVIMGMDQLPLGPSGKVNRKSLPEPVVEQAILHSPRTPLEQTLADIFAEVLGLEAVDTRTSFFELGGDSILSLKLIARARAEGLVFRPTQLLEAQSIEALAPLVEQAPRRVDETPSEGDFPMADLDAEALETLLKDIPDAQDIYPLSIMQEGMLFHSSYEEGKDIYFEQVCFDIAGPIDLSAFYKAWNLVLKRHTALRTSFYWKKLKQPRQVVSHAPPIPMETWDYRSYDDTEQRKKRDQQMAAQRRQGFDLEKAPLMSISLMRYADEGYWFVWSYHHLTFDGWSLGIVLGDFLDAYAGICRGEEPDTESRPPYRNFIQYLEGVEQADSKAFWQEDLAVGGVPTRLPEGDGTMASPMEHEDQATYTTTLSEALSADLLKMAREHHLTINTLFQGAWSLLLAHYSNRQSTIFGTTVSGRPTDLPGVEQTVGLFINTLPVSVAIPPGERLLPWLANLHRRQVEREAYSHTALAKIQAWSAHSSQMALFESILIFENYPLDVSEKDANGLNISLIKQEEPARYPLTLTVFPYDQFTLRLGVDAQHVGNPYQRSLDHLSALLRCMTQNPQLRLESLNPLSEEERGLLLRTWNNPRALFPTQAPLHHFFEKRVLIAPDHVALIETDGHSDTMLTYDELNRRANRLAHHLRSLGAGPEVLVALCMPRGIDLLVGLLGILKTGAAYIPIDPEYPRERIDLILTDSQAPLLVASKNARDRLGKHTAQIVAPDQLPEDLPTSNLGLGDIDNVAYVIYTSGSTGKPKGVPVPHAKVDRLFEATRKWFHFDDRDIWIMFHSFAFDFSVWEIWGALLHGGCLICIPYWLTRSPGELLSLISDYRVTILCQTPSAFVQLINCEEALDDPPPLALRAVIFGGEALDPKTLEPFAARHGVQVDLVNMYGITETTIHVTYHKLVKQDLSTRASVIGKPMEDLQVYVLSPQMMLLPIGVPGELFVGGEGLSRGYLKRPSLTAQRFIPNPFATRPGARLYRTGDLARYRGDGSLLYLGRTDRQIKLRGFRIEVGEIEGVLLQHASVKEALVLLRKDGPSGAYLAAYAIPKAGVQMEAADFSLLLHEHLSANLPEHMVPAATVMLAEMPLTAHGKVDTAALPVPGTHAHVTREYRPPSNENETTLVGIWSELLDVAQVGIDDNFFELGGDSILSIQMVARVRQAGFKVNPKQLFENPTVAQLAPHLSALSEKRAIQGEVTGPVPLSPIQHWFLNQNPPDVHHYNQAIMFQLSDALDQAALAEAVTALPLHHDALRMSYSQMNTGWQQENRGKRDFVLDVIERSDLSGHQASAFIEEQAAALQCGLDLEQGLLFKAALFVVSDRRNLLLIVHHLVVDGVSWRILLEDLRQNYERLASGRKLSWPAKTTSFKEWSELLSDYAQSEEIQEALAYWRSSIPQSWLPLPQTLVESTGNNTVAEAGMVTQSLNATATGHLLKDIHHAYRTRINDVLLSALAITFSRNTGLPGLVIDLEGHGREDLFEGVDLSRTVGWFTTMFPIYLQVSQPISPGEVLKLTKERLRGIPQNGLSFGILKHLTPGGAEALADLPNAEVLFNYLGQTDADLMASDLMWPAEEDIGQVQSPMSRRSHLLEINCMISKGRLVMAWRYPTRLMDRDAVVELASGMETALHELVAHCREPDAGGFTPSDFPLARLDQTGLDRLIGAAGKVVSVFPLTAMQQGMLIRALDDTAVDPYFQQLTCLLNGDLDLVRFTNAWNRVIARHASLATAFFWSGLDQPLQVVQADVTLPIQVLDWRMLDEEQIQEKWQALRARDREQGFDLEQAPLMRATLVLMDRGSYRFLWSFHHLLMDGWSMAIVLKEMLTCYREGERVVLSPPTVSSFHDYVVWAHAQESAESEAFWSADLAGVTHCPLPAFAHEELGKGPEHDVVILDLDEKETELLGELARVNRQTLNILFQASWSLLLSRFLGSRDLVFGTTVAGRPHELRDVESTVGMFINTLPVRIQLPEVKALDWLHALASRQVERERFAHTPLPQILAWSGIPRGSTLFESLLVFENYPLDEHLHKAGGSLTVSDVSLDDGPPYPLTIGILPGRCLRFRAEYLTARISRETVAYMLGRLKLLPAIILSSPDVTTAYIPLHTHEEKAMILDTCHSREVEHVKNYLLDELIQRHASETPEKTAIVVEDGSDSGFSMDYAALEARVQLLSNRLRKLGLQPRQRVGLLLSRDHHLVTSMLAVIRCGGVFIYLDRDYPINRLSEIAQDSAMSFVLHDHAQIAERVSPTATCIHIPSVDDQQGDPSHPLPKVHDANCYMIYTSGSTGKPKGTVVSHDNLVNTLLGASQTFEFGPADRMPCLAAFSFDISLFELLAPLVSGATTELIRRETALDIPRLARMLRGVTRLHALPALMNQIVAYAKETQAFDNIGMVFVGGDRVPPGLLRNMVTAFPNARLVVLYGPTEGTIICASYEVDRNAVPETTFIGVPLPGVTLLITDPMQRLTPKGVPGELLIGGNGVTRGYLGRNAETARNFIRMDGQRYYRTGDRARRHSDGNLEFMGRIDRQVKIRGFRVEPGEIEKLIESLDAVSQAAVVVPDAGTPSARLVAFLVPADPARTVDDANGDLVRFVRTHVASQLPDYMMPSHFQVIDQLPLTRNDKVDFKSLLALEKGVKAAPLNDASVAPRNDRERMMAAIWSEILDVKDVGIHDNFFELGGDSILAMRVAARCRKENLSLVPTLIFQHQTIAELCPKLVTSKARVQNSPLKGSLPLTPIQLSMLTADGPAPHHFNQALMFKVSKQLSLDTLKQALTFLTDHHDALRLRFVYKNGTWLQAYSPAGQEFPLRARYQSIREDIDDLQGSFDLENGPLMGALFSLEPNESSLLLVFHHLLVDGVSWRILLADLQLICAQLIAGENVYLGEKTTSLRTWTEYVTAYATDEARAQLAYWESQGNAVQPPPGWEKTPAHGGTFGTARRENQLLDATYTEHLLRDVHKAYNTRVDDFLVTALLCAVANWTGRHSCCLGMESHGREPLFPEVDLSSTVGWFTAAYPLSLTLPHGTRLDERLKAVKEQLRAVPDGGLGYGALRYLGEDDARTRLARQERPWLGYNYLGQAGETKEGLLTLVEADCGPLMHRDRKRPQPLSLDAMVRQGRLELAWTWCEELFEEADISNLASDTLAWLKMLIDHALEPGVGAFTPSDFALAEIDEQQLTTLLEVAPNLVDAYPLTPMQQGMLFQCMYQEQGPDQYFESFRFSLQGKLEEHAFKQAWQDVVAAHDICRTSFHWQSLANPLQVVHAHADIPWQFLDWRDLSAAEQESQMGLLEQDMKAKGFDLARAPLMSLTLFRLSNDSYQLIWCHHHLLLDGWSLPLILNQVLAAYESRLKGLESVVGKGQPFRNYIEWLSKQDQATAEAFWRKNLRGFTDCKDLPQVARKDKFETGHVTEKLVLDAQLTSQLVALSRATRLTTNVLVQGAWAMLLSCWSSSFDVIFGSTVAGRPPELQGVESMVGLFINTLPVCLHLDPHTPLVQWLAEMPQSGAEREAHGYVSLAKIQEWSEVPRGTDLFQTILIFENYPLDGPLGRDLGGLEVRVAGHDEQPRYGITVTALPGEALTLLMTLEKARASTAPFSRIGSHLESLFRQMVADCQAPLGSFSPLTPEERQLLLSDWNDESKRFPPRAPLHVLFETRAASNPLAQALLFAESEAHAPTLSYGELNSRANRLAHHLIRRGAGPEMLIALCMHRSIDLVVALLGILKAGAAYVPLDPNYPAERIQLILGDSGTPMLVAQPETLDHLPPHGAVVIDPGALDEGLPDHNPEVGGIDHPAYVIYTSGSTGRPKGIPVAHANVVRLFAATDRHFAFDENDTWAMFHSFAFDFSVWELWGALLHGGRLLLLPQWLSRSPEDFYKLMLREKLTVLCQTPSAFGQLVRLEDTLEEPGRLALRLVIFGGEALEPTALRSFAGHYGDRVALVNMYGITETTVHVTYHRMTDEDLAGRGSVIGRPIDDLQVYVLDKRLRVLPIGVVGELFVSGDGLARGYLKRPALTASRFIPDPFSQRPGSRLYRTGDLGFHRDSGELVYMGRSDRQVKVRGFRIELGEIEAVLDAHPRVAESLVLVRDNPSEHGRGTMLVGYVVPTAVDGPDLVEELRGYLRGEMPEYMVPGALLLLEQMPLTSHGKIDKQALPLPGHDLSKAHFIAPRNEAETILCQTWENILGLDNVGVTDNFFELGGDSIISIQMVARVRARGLSVTPRQLFENPTIEALARLAEPISTIHAQQDLVSGDVPLTPIQHWYFENPRIEPALFNQAVFLELPYALNQEFLDRCLDLLTRHHDGLRLRFRHTDTGWQQWVAPPDEPVRSSWCDLSEYTAEELPDLLEEHATRAHRGMDLERGPLLRAVQFALPGEAYRLLLSAHHLLIDGVSWRILLEDLETLYNQLSQGKTAELPPKTTSYRAWSEKLSKLASGEEIAEQAAYWRTLAGRIASRPPVSLAVEAEPAAPHIPVSVALTPEETRQLLQSAPAAYHTRINDLLLSALVLTLTHEPGEAVLLHLEGHGREPVFEDIDLTRTIGWFTALYPVLLERADIGLADTIKSVKEQLRQVPDGGLGYGLLRYLAADPDVSALPKCQILFNYLGRLDGDEAASSLFKMCDDPLGETASPAVQHLYALEINGLVTGERLRLDLTYDPAKLSHGQVLRLAESFGANLRELIDHCLAPENGGYTPSDFPLAGTDMALLDAISRETPDLQDLYPLTPTMRGLLFHTQLNPDSDMYAVQFRVELSGPLNPEAFFRAWRDTAGANEVFRTSIYWEDLDVPLQRVHASVVLPWSYHDWREEPDARGLWEELLSKERTMGFQLDKAPLLRCHLARIGETSYLFSWCYHHLLMDGWSLAQIFTEVLARYKGLTSGQMPALPSRRPYRDYIAWLQKRTDGEDERFWRENLKGYSEPLSLPIPTRRGEPSSHGEMCSSLDEQASAAINQFARNHRLTPHTLAQAAFGLLLFRYSGRRDLVFGTVVSGRPPELKGVESMVGLFISTQPKRVRITAHESLLGWLKQLQAQQVAQERFSYSSLSDIQEWSDCPPGTALFEQLFIFENYPMDSQPTGEDDEVTMVSTRGWERTNYPIGLTVEPGNTFNLRLAYVAGRYSSSTIDLLLKHYGKLLTSLVEHVHQPLHSLSLLSDDERTYALETWNRCDSMALPHQTLLDLIEAKVAEIPQKQALTFQAADKLEPARSLSYAALNARSDCLAHRLVQMGAGPGSLVAVCVDRSLEMVISLLAVMKTGAAYIPLDPHQPAARLAMILESARPPLMVLAQTPDQPVFLPDSDYRPMVLNLSQEVLEAEGLPFRRNDPDPDQLAYVIYTSGSTGVPKGVQISHRALLNFLLSVARSPGLTAADTLLALTTLSFDIAGLELFLPLICGGSLVVTDSVTASDSARLGELVEEYKVTVMQATPATWQMLVNDGWRGLPGLKILCGGEALPGPLAVSLLACGESLWNMYGPTETTIWSGALQVSRQLAERTGGATLAVGGVLDNTSLYLLDEDLQPLPEQVPGELMIGGDGLARGYYNQPALTAQKFIPSPFSTTRGGRIYKTGDLMSYAAPNGADQGLLTFHQRLDFQIKVRGYRIEPGDIEACLRSHESVRDAVILALGEDPYKRRLVAFVTTTMEMPDTSPLRGFLAERLPHYMVPAKIVALEAFPFTPNGKLDRARLATLDGASRQEFTPPRTPLEEKIATIWTVLLKLERVSVHDDFFELGGNSLVATRIISHMNEALPFPLTLNLLFEQRTIAALVAYSEASAEVAQNIQATSNTESEDDREELEL